MKLAKRGRNIKKRINDFSSDDMKYLQKKISGQSVYKKLGGLYKRNPKHKAGAYQY